jgi:hypothetical protein
MAARFVLRDETHFRNKLNGGGVTKERESTPQLLQSPRAHHLQELNAVAPGSAACGIFFHRGAQRCIPVLLLIFFIETLIALLFGIVAVAVESFPRGRARSMLQSRDSLIRFLCLKRDACSWYELSRFEKPTLANNKQKAIQRSAQKICSTHGQTPAQTKLSDEKTTCKSRRRAYVTDLRLQRCRLQRRCPKKPGPLHEIHERGQLATTGTKYRRDAR